MAAEPSWILWMISLGLSALSVVAVAVVMASSRHATPARRSSRESFLAPVLAADALDEDLRPLYARSLVFEALDAHGEGARLGRELRRWLLDLQALRHASRADARLPAELVASIVAASVAEARASWPALRQRIEDEREQIHGAASRSEDSGGIEPGP